MTNKNHIDTRRIFFKRRHNSEAKPLLILDATKLLLCIERPDGESRELMKVNIEFLRLIAEVLPYYQTVLLLKYVEGYTLEWIKEVMLEDLGLKVDGIYTLMSKRPSLWLDLS